MLYRARERPDPGAFVLAGVDPANFRRREWTRILKRARIGHRALKDLRDTFASQLLTAGVQLGYVSQQLGHSNVATTLTSYGTIPLHRQRELIRAAGKQDEKEEKLDRLLELVERMS